MKSFKVNTTNLDKLSKFLDLVSEKSKPILETIAVKRLAESAAFLFDQLYDSQDHLEESALTKARTNLLARQNHDSPDCFFGLNAEITILSPKTALVSFVSPFIEELNQTIEKSAAKLNLKLTEHKHTSKDNTLRAILITNFLPKESNIESHIPSFEERCNHAAHNGCFVKFLNEISEYDHITTRAVEDFRLWLQTDEGSASFEAALNYCKANLKRTIKNNDL